MEVVAAVVEEDVVKKRYLTFIKGIILDPVMSGLRTTDFAAFLDKVTDVFEYMIEHFDESQRFLTTNFRNVASTVANTNLTECAKIVILQNRPPHVLERAEYLTLVLERFLFLIRTRDFSL